MKIWLFIRHANRRGSLDPPLLYAFTKKKRIAFEFKKVRNMEHFLMKEKDITNDEYHEICKKFTSLELRLTGLKTFNKVEGRSSVVYLPITKNEEEITIIKGDDLLENELIKKSYMDFSVIKSKYYNALDNIDYFDHHLKCSIDEDRYFYSGLYDMSNIIEKYDLIDSKYNTDQLAFFLYFFGETMKDEK